MESSQLTSATATELIDLLEGETVSSVEITQAFIQRIQAVDQKVHAFLHLDEEDMIKQAKSSDERRSQGKSLTRLDGIPVGLKDVIQC